MTIDIDLFDPASIDKAIMKLYGISTEIEDCTASICERAAEVGAANAEQVYAEHRSNFDSDTYDVTVGHDAHRIWASGDDVGWVEYGFGITQPSANTPGGPPHGSISKRPAWHYNGHVSYGSPPANALWEATLAAQQELYLAAADKVGEILR